MKPRDLLDLVLLAALWAAWPSEPPSVGAWAAVLTLGIACTGLHRPAPAWPTCFIFG